MAGSVASSLVSSRLDYVNSIVYGKSLKNINRLQRIQYSLARVVTYRRSHALPSATALLKQLHWLLVEWRIRFKLATMTFKALHKGRPPYLTDQLQYYQPTRSLRSSGSHQLVKPRHNLSFGSRAFRISAPHIWNSLPTNIREAHSLLTFRRHLKTHYFQSAVSTPSRPARKLALILLKISALYESFTYLLTLHNVYHETRHHMTSDSSPGPTPSPCRACMTSWLSIALATLPPSVNRLLTG